MSRFIPLVAVLLLALPVLAMAETKSGTIKLEESEFGPPKGAAKIELGKDLKASVSFYIAEFFGSKVIKCGPTLKNTTSPSTSITGAQRRPST